MNAPVNADRRRRSRLPPPARRLPPPRPRRGGRMLLVILLALSGAAATGSPLPPAGTITLQAWTTVASLPFPPAGETGTAPPALPPGDGHSVLGPPTLTAAQIDRILAAWGSPAAGTGAAWIAYGMQYGIDPAYALAFFIHESGAGTAPGWAGRKPDGGTTHNIGNIICAGYQRCYGRFRDYASWEEGIADWYRLIAVEYVAWRGVHTVEEIVPIYAPAVENNVSAYIDAVNRLVAEWRAAHARSWD